MKRIIAIAVAVLLVSSVASAQTVVEIDTQHGLTDQAKIDSYENTGYAETTIDQVGLTVRIAEKADQLNVSTMKLDTTNVFLQFEYRDSIPRDLRIYIPSEYVKPSPKDGETAIDSSIKADFLPVEDRNYTSVSVSFSNSGEATFAISKTAGEVFSVRASVRDFTENQLNVSIPSFSGVEYEWTHNDTDDWMEDGTLLYIPTNGTTTVQYRMSETDPWYTVQTQSRNPGDIYKFRKNERLYVANFHETIPEVRYKPTNDISARIKSAVNEIMSIPKRVGEVIRGVL